MAQFIKKSDMKKTLGTPEMQKRLEEICNSSPLGQIVSKNQFEDWLQNGDNGTAVSVCFATLLRMAYESLVNPTMHSIVFVGTNRNDTNMGDGEIASRLGLLIDDVQKVESGYYNCATYTGESSELSLTIYRQEIDGKTYYMFHDGGHRFFLLCELVCGCKFNKARRDGQHDKYIELFNKYIGGRAYCVNKDGVMMDDDETITACVNKMLSMVPFRVKMEDKAFDMAIRCEDKKFKTQESLHKNWCQSFLYQHLFYLHAQQNDTLHVVSNRKDSALKFVNDVAFAVSEFCGYYLTKGHTSIEAFFHDVTNSNDVELHKRVEEIINQYLNLYQQPDVYPFFRAFNTMKSGNRSIYCGYKDGTTVPNTNVAIRMALDSVYEMPTFQSHYANAYVAWKKEIEKKKRADMKTRGRHRVYNTSFRCFFESTYLNMSEIHGNGFGANDVVLAARLDLAENILAFFEKNASYFRTYGEDICQTIVANKIVDGVGQPSKYTDVVSKVQATYFGKQKRKPLIANACGIVVPTAGGCKQTKKTTSSKKSNCQKAKNKKGAVTL